MFPSFRELLLPDQFWLSSTTNVPPNPTGSGATLLERRGGRLERRVQVLVDFAVRSLTREGRVRSEAGRSRSTGRRDGRRSDGVRVVVGGVKGRLFVLGDPLGLVANVLNLFRDGRVKAVDFLPDRRVERGKVVLFANDPSRVGLERQAVLLVQLAGFGLGALDRRRGLGPDALAERVEEGEEALTDAVLCKPGIRLNISLGACTCLGHPFLRRKREDRAHACRPRWPSGRPSR